ncbi:MAG: hypothetical protein KME31_34670 [Tolypothrix carrinoi HA7290-LM1]|jgi:hypothetical protein|nr:hypothetical protein [Tolypothrix carrinoi HA7290-LM1]
MTYQQVKQLKTEEFKRLCRVRPEVVRERSPSFLLKLSQCRFERPRAIATNRSEVRWAFAPPEAIAKFQADTVSVMPAAFHFPAKTLRDPLMVSPKLKRLLRQNWLECGATQML